MVRNPRFAISCAYRPECCSLTAPNAPQQAMAGSLPSASDPIKELSTVIKCYPDSDASTLDTVAVYSKRPNGWKSIGNTKDEMKDI